MELAQQPLFPETGAAKDSLDVPMSAKHARRFRTMEIQFRFLSAMFGGHGHDDAAPTAGSGNQPVQEFRPSEVTEVDSMTFALWVLRRSRRRR